MTRPSRLGPLDRRPRRPGARIAALFFLAVGLLWNIPSAAQPADWSGRWNGFLPESMILMELRQDGATVTGTYRPGDGRIEAVADGRVLEGRWIEVQAEGRFRFLMAEDGQAFSGADDRGSYWNGGRIDADRLEAPALGDLRTASGALRTIIAGLNRTWTGDASAALVWDPLLLFDGPETTALDRRYRRIMLFWLIDMATFQAKWVEFSAQTDTAALPVGPVDSTWRFDLRMERGDDGIWRLVVPPVDALADTLEDGLAATGHESYDAFRAARPIGPRQTMRSFLESVGRWDTGGREAALATLDLSYLPPHLRAVEGAVLADYLRQVIDRVGYVVWQEIPDDPDLAAPYIHYRHPAGRIEIVAVDVPPPEGSQEPPERAWQFSRDTLRSLPDLYAATREMAVAEGLAAPEPLSQFFRTRLWFERNQPVLLNRYLGLELWQWAAVAATALGTVIALVGVRWALVLVGRLPGLHWAPLFDWPLRLLAVGWVFKLLVTYAGLRTDLAQIVEALAILALIAGTTGIVFQLVGPAVRGIQSLLQRRGVSDDIVAALVSGLLRFAVVLLGILVAADAMGLPYEGVIAGLGVGGIALAFAARETVANLIGAVILLSDRPFRQGDLIEAEGTMATVESVGLRSTRLRTLDDSLLIVPNSRLSENALNNWGRRRNRKLVLQIGLTYDTPREKLDIFTARLRQIYYNHPRASDPLYLGMRGFGDSSIDIELWGYVRAPSYEDFVDAQHRLIGDIVDAAEEIGVAFAFPTRTLHMARPAVPAIAEDPEPRAEAG